MDKVLVVQKMQDYIEEHLSENPYDPSIIGYEWDDTNPRIQLEPRGERGYIEMKAVRPL